jgi:hypothetical protein
VETPEFLVNYEMCHFWSLTLTHSHNVANATSRHFPLSSLRSTSHDRSQPEQSGNDRHHDSFGVALVLFG